MSINALKKSPILAGGILGAVIGFVFIGEVVQSDAQGTQKEVNAAQPTQGHLLKLADALPGGRTEAAEDPLDPAVIRRLRDIQPAANGAQSLKLQERLIDDAREGSLAATAPVYSLHLASISDPSSVEETINTLRFDSSSQLIGANFEAVEGVQPSGARGFTRILAGSFSSLGMAEEACAILRQDGQYCSVLERLED